MFLHRKHLTGAIVALFLLVVGITIIYTRAGDTLTGESPITTVTIDNAAPTIDAIYFSTNAYGADNLTSSGISPSVGADRTIYVTGVITDANGDTDVASTSLAFNRSAFTTSCTSDKNNCYHVSACDMDTAYGTVTEVAFSCPVSLAYWIDATDASGRYADTNWVATVIVTDAAAQDAIASSSIEVNSLLALNIPTAINYGARTLAEQSTAGSNIETVLTQKGNAAVDVEVYGTAMSCNVLGAIPVGNQRWNLLDGGYTATSSNTLTGTSVPTHRNILFRDNDGAELTESLYWNLAVPATGVKGTCTGTNTITIVAYQGDNGFFIDARLANVAYSSNTVTGRTGLNGSFRYYPDDTLTFSIGGVTLGSLDTNDIPGDHKVVLADLFGLAPRANLNDTRLLNIARFLLALDSDPSSTSTLTIHEDAYTALVNTINFSTANDSLLTSELQTVYATGTLPSVATAQNHLAATYVVENITTYAAPTLSLVASATTTAYNGSVNLSWTTTGVNTCTASGGWSGSQATSSAGVSTGSLTTTTTYTLTCAGYGGTVSDSVTVSTEANPTISLTAATTTVALNASTTLTWSTTNASTCTASGGWSGSKATSGSNSTGNIATTTTFTLTCTNSIGVSTSSNVTIVPVANPTITLSAASSTIAFDTVTTLTWSTTNASACTASGGWSGSKATSGSGVSTGNLATTTTFTLSCTSSTGVSTSTDVVVSVVPNPTISFSAADTSLAYNASTTLSWSTTNASACTASGGWSGSKATSGSGVSTGNLTDDTAFTLGCMNSVGVSTSSSVSIAVGPLMVSLPFEAGTNASFAIQTNGTLSAWGANTNGELGIGNTTSPQPSPVQVGSDTKWKQIVMSPFSVGFAAAIRYDGTLWAWGFNNGSLLGTGTTTTPLTSPLQVGTSTEWKLLAAGQNYTLALKSDGTLWAWGNGANGRLGLGDTASRTSPVQVGTSTNWVQIATAGGTSLAIKSDGTLWAWGLNTNGELGRGNTGGTQLTPLQIGSATDWASVSAGRSTSYALKTNGTLWAWGLNTSGELGRGNTTSPQTSPVQIGTDTDWTQVDGGGFYALGRKSGGTIYGWGSNTAGQTGGGTLSPVQIGTDTDWIRVAAGNTVSLARKNDSTLWVWGDNTNGTFGNGSTGGSTSVPAQVSGIMLVYHVSADSLAVKETTFAYSGAQTAAVTDAIPEGTDSFIERIRAWLIGLVITTFRE